MTAKLNDRQKLDQLCRYAITGDFRGLLDKMQANTTVWASYNGAGSVNLKLFQNKQLIYSDQFSLFDHDLAKALFGVNPKICTMCDRTHAYNADCDAGGWPMSGMDNYLWQMQEAVVSADPIDYYHSAVFGAEHEG